MYEVPGAFELPFAARAVALARRVDAVVCLGCVIRGETPHFEYVASAAANGIMSAQMGAGVPMAFGVLTTNTPAEADARSGPGDDNKGREAARVAIEMALLRPPARRQPRPAGAPGVTTPGAAPDVRHRAREAALQMLYQWEASGSDLEDVRRRLPSRSGRTR